MSIALMTRIFASAEPREAADRLMLLALADNANDQGVCWPAIGTLARKCAVARRNAAATMRRLEEAGFVRTEPPHPGRKTNTFVVMVERLSPPKDDARVKDDVGIRGDAGIRDDVDGTGAVDDIPTPDAGVIPTPDAGVIPTPDVGITPPLMPASSESSENPNQNPHHNHQSATHGDGALRLVRPPAGVVVVGDDREGEAEVPRPDGSASSRATQALIERGVTEPVAARLASDFAGRINAALAAFDRSGQYGPGWLVRAVEAGWADEKPAPHASREQGAARPPQGAYGPVAEPRRMQTQAVLWLEQQGHPASALAEFFEPAGTWEMDPDTPPVAMYRLRASVATPRPSSGAPS